MTIWKSGMLAVCVDDGPVKEFCNLPEVRPGEVYLVENLKAGKTYQVDRVYSDNHGVGLLALRMKEPAAGVSQRFRPAALDDKSADEQFTRQLDDIIKGRVPAEMSA